MDDKQSREQLEDPEYWDQAWQQAREDSRLDRHHESDELIDFWNNKADYFRDNVLGEKGHRRVERDLSWLTANGVNLAGSRVLDIGSGPGAFTIPFARQAEEVVALEPADKMVFFLQKELKREGIDNVQVIQSTWEDLVLEEADLDYIDAFDLVFASMSPGINNWQTVKKVLRCGSKYCYFSAFAGKRRNSALVDLWPIVFDCELPSWPGDILYLVNLLYTKGFDLSFEVWEEESEVKLPVNEAVDRLMNKFRDYGEEGDEIRVKVKNYVEARADNGCFTQWTTSRLGRILVKNPQV